ncbi:MAG: hypothetical protein HQK50_05130 [Oligoflexia bacterium]|nr:hypothetical protein [Oligoflexia bacterium]
MFQLIKFLLVLLLTLSYSCSLSFAKSTATTTDDLLKQIESAEESKLPKRALELAQKLELAAKAEDKKGLYVRAIAKRILNQCHILGKMPKDKIRILQAEIAKVDMESLPLVKLILAKWFWHYYEQNRFKFAERTQVQAGSSDDKDDDFTTWDLNKIQREIHHLYQEVLKDKSALKKIKISDYEGVIEGGNIFNTKTTTLYEFALLEMIQFFKASDQPALPLYQELVYYYQQNNFVEELITIKVARLKYLYADTADPAKKAELKKSLTSLIAKHAALASSALASHELAQAFYDEQEFSKAALVCEKAIEKHANSDGGKLCANLTHQIKRAHFSIKTESSINEDNSTLSISYKNISKIYFRLIADTTPIPKAFPDLNTLLKQTTIKEWSIELHPTSDYKEALEIFPLPEVPHGFYHLFASSAPDFKQKADLHLSYTSFWRSDSLLLIKEENQALKGFVLDAHTGAPLSDTTLEVYENNQQDHYQKVATTNTNGDGIFSYEPLAKQKSYLNLGRYFKVISPQNGDTLFTSYLQQNPSLQKHQGTKALILTDRAIYRPSQRIHFKVICYSFDQEREQYASKQCKNLEVKLYDNNQQELAKMVGNANEFGSFAGDFLIPAHTLLGDLSLRTSSPTGEAQVKVEEYRRPKFEITLTPPVAQFRLNDKVSISGKAVTYAGAPLPATSRVKYRIVRNVEMPPWWFYWKMLLPSSKAMELGHGVTSLNDLGEFSLSFVATPDAKIDPKSKPHFTFNLEVEVTDATGETHAQSLEFKLGYTALSATLSSIDWLLEESPTAITITTTTLDGKECAASGTLQIFELQAPARPKRTATTTTMAMAKPLAKEIIASWPQGKLLESQTFATSLDGKSTHSFKLKSGAYVAILTSKDQFAQEVIEKHHFIVFNKEEFKLPLPSFFTLNKTSFAPSEKLEALWATGYGSGRAYISFLQNGKSFKSYWTAKNSGLHFINLPLTKEHQGGFTLQILFVQENQIYFYNQLITVTRPEKRLNLSLETITNKLKPNEEQLFTLKISDAQNSSSTAEVVATMYDASLDALFTAHTFPNFSFSYWSDTLASAYSSTLTSKEMRTYQTPPHHYTHVERRYPEFTADIAYQFNQLFPQAFSPLDGHRSFAKMKGGMEMMQMSASTMMEDSPSTPLSTPPSTPIRSNLQESAFFYPQLLSDEKGVVKIAFTSPQALSKWNFMAFAHGKKSEFGTLTKEFITQKELMLTLNTPRFVRQGDSFKLIAKIDNLSNEDLKGDASLELFDAKSAALVTSNFIPTDKSKQKSFSVPAKKSTTLSWQVHIPDVTYPLQYLIKASTKQFTDGEEGVIPILPRKIFVQESMPFWINGKGSKDFLFTKLANSKASLEHEKLIVQMVSNPLWYVVQSLPYLRKSSLECSDYLFERLFANLLGEKIVALNPLIEKTFAKWKFPPTSPLKAKQDLKSVTLEETPWVNEAKDEEQARAEIAKFFDKNNLQQELALAYQELEARMLPSGGFAWFAGGEIDHYTTLYIVSGFGKLKHLNVNTNYTLAMRSLASLDNFIQKQYQTITNDGHKEQNHYSHLIAYYLYGRSFFLKDAPLNQHHQEAVNYYLEQAARYWPTLNSRLSEANTALAAYRFGKKELTRAITKSLRERALHDKEMGMYWGDEEWGYSWYHAPIETQARIIELFSESISPLPSKELEEMNIWALKQKQTQSWKTSKATAEIIYTMLYTNPKGITLLANQAITSVKLSNKELTPTAEEVSDGSGYYEKRFSAKEITASMGHLSLVKKEDGISWGGLHWHYFEDLSKITPHKTPLSLSKTLWIKRNSKSGPTLHPLEKSTPVLGDKLVVRLKLKVDRDMEYVYMKEMRASGTEPLNVLSSWKYQDGLSYYESTKDSATHFFFPYLPKGTFVFEYELSLTHTGHFQTGIATIESLYAPEFSSHSQSYSLKVGAI